MKKGNMVRDDDRGKEKGVLMWSIVNRWIRDLTFFISGQMKTMIDQINKDQYQFEKTEWINEELRKDPKLSKHNLSGLQKKIL